VRGPIRRFLGPELVRSRVFVAGAQARARVGRRVVIRLGYRVVTITLAAMSRVALLGGGKMGAALVGGLLEGGWEADTLSIAEIDGDRRMSLEQQFPKVRVVPSAAWAVADADVVIVAVKPGDVEATLATALPALGTGTLVLSIAAGVTIAHLESFAPDRPVVRAMPNTPALVGLGASAIAGGTHAGPDHLDLAERLLGFVGVVVRVSESMLDAVTGLSGSGPAYVFLVAEAMIEAGVLVGLARDVSTRLVVQTILGSATLLAQDASGPEALRAAVTSPGGTTASGLRELEAHGVRAAMLDAVNAATQRSRELGAG
jgi:pyrroline-5-carboxylate reductase